WAKSDKPARVRNMVCDRNVQIEDSTRDEAGKVLRYQYIGGTAFAMNALESDEPRKANAKAEGNEANTTGPGVLRLFQPGNNEFVTEPGDPKPKAPEQGKEPGTKLTYVAFKTRMYANSKTNTAIFW